MEGGTSDTRSPFRLGYGSRFTHKVIKFSLGQEERSRTIYQCTGDSGSSLKDLEDVFKKGVEDLL